MVRTVNIRALKDRLSACLRDVQNGDILLVTDRGRVVAEVRKPVVGTHVLDALFDRRQQLIESGVLRPGLPHDPRLYRRKPAARLPAAAVDAALAYTRGDR